MKQLHTLFQSPYLRGTMSQLSAFWLSGFILLFCFRAHICAADDRLFQGQSLFGDQTIVSSGGKFELGFFTPGNSLKYYIGIWYKLPKQTVVWVANRQKPVSSASSSELKLDEDGNLVLTDSKNQIWSSNSSNIFASNSTIAVLLDNGNLVLKDNLSSNILWQSFDHPTNTYLPGEKLGYNKFTGQDRFLTSWRNPEDPSPGMFTFEIDPDGVAQFYLLKNRRYRYWSTGVWTGEIFPAVPEMRSGYFVNFTNVSNSNVNEFTYSVHDTSSIHHFMLDFTGEMKRLKWNNDTEDWLQFGSLPRDPCDVEGRCGRFSSCNNFSSPYCQCLQGFKPKSTKKWNLGDQTGGCIRKTPLQCGQNDGFLKLSNMQLPVNPTHLSASSPEVCQIDCSRNCSCTAYAYYLQCSIWHGDLFDLKSLSDSLSIEAESGVIYVRVEASELANHDHKNWRMPMIIVLSAVVPGIAVITIIVLLLALRCRRRTTTKASDMVQGPLVAFDYKALRKATKEFSEKLGRGSFGTVFKGELPDSSLIAVKRLESIRQGEKQFRMEVNTIGMIHHINLVRLRGFCCEGDKRLLVYDYMPLGSLDSVLFTDGSEVLGWKQRYEIALGIARGLAYLHEKCRECIMHCDIKPENILIDIDMCPKIADFGMAKLLGREFSRVLTTVRGTFGYLAPEWITGSAVTPKADVYSYGLMLLEIVSGRRNTDRCEEWNRLYFPLWALIKMHEGDSLCLLDPKLKGGTDEEELSRVCRIACWCIQDLESHRPTMGEVVQQLEGVWDVSLPPIPGLLQKLLVCDNSAEDNYYSTL